MGTHSAPGLSLSHGLSRVSFLELTQLQRSGACILSQRRDMWASCVPSPGGLEVPSRPLG